jgi:hypothetical protein
MAAVIHRSNHPLAQISGAPQHACCGLRISAHFPGSILPLDAKSLTRTRKRLIHEIPTPNHHTIRKVSHPAAQHLRKSQVTQSAQSATFGLAVQDFRDVPKARGLRIS